jgi:methylated-DNA-[protein]-cysteine S-methyltransferase
LAALAGRPRAARAVGNVMATNLTPLIVPCHRVVAAGNSLGGFSAVGGTNTKLRLLELEAGRESAARARKKPR